MRSGRYGTRRFKTGTPTNHLHRHNLIGLLLYPNYGGGNHAYAALIHPNFALTGRGRLEAQRASSPSNASYMVERHPIYGTASTRNGAGTAAFDFFSSGMLDRHVAAKINTYGITVMQWFEYTSNFTNEFPNLNSTGFSYNSANGFFLGVPSTTDMRFAVQNGTPTRAWGDSVLFSNPTVTAKSAGARDVLIGGMTPGGKVWLCVGGTRVPNPQYGETQMTGSLAYTTGAVGFGNGTYQTAKHGGAAMWLGCPFSPEEMKRIVQMRNPADLFYS